MNCRSCGRANREGARFCTSCGAALAPRCQSCGVELPDDARFCDSCGSPVDVEPAAEPVLAARKVVTVLFADMCGSTSLEEEMDAERVRSLLDRFYAALRAEVDKRGGRVVKFTGDGLMAAFGIPEVHEDDATRALDAAIAMCTACDQLASETGHSGLALKVGVNTGEVVVIEDDDDVVGDAVNIASRLEGAAEAGEVLVGEGTWRLTRATSRYESVEPLVLKGKSEPVPAYRLLSVEEGTADTLAAPFVGRDAELERLVAVFDETVASNAARLVTIVGSPGLGKTRLAQELALKLADRAVVREARCDPAGSSTFAPIAETLRAAASISETAPEQEVVAALAALIPLDDPDRDRIASRVAGILGAGEPGSTEETFWALRRMIETAALDQPRVIVLDDLHWAEPVLLDLVEHLAEWIRDAPVLLVGTGRPELRDIRPSLVEGGRAAAVIALEGLDERATERLALGLLGTDQVPTELLARIPASTEGNPLFVRELVRMLVDDGVLRRDGEVWNVTVDVDAIEVPPTIQSLLAARMDRLRSDERTVIELASVIGKEFYRGAVRELAPPSVREQLDTCLESLRRKEMVEPAGTYWIDEPVFRFHHVLIRDAAYRRLLKESRAELHERVAEWLERKTEHVLGEHEEVIGYHLEQAHEYLRQLGRTNDELGRRAAALLGDGAQRALDRDDLPAAAALSGRALDRLPADDPDRSALLLVRCEALLSMGDVTSGGAAVVDLERLADSPRLAAWATCFAGELANLTAPERLQETEKRVAAAASELAELEDPAGAAKAHTVHGSTLARLGRFAECETALDAALTAAREANDRRRITAVLGSAPLAALWGPNPVSRAGGRCLDLVRLSRITTGSPGVEVTSLRCQAVLEAFRGRADAARRMLRSARRTLEELGLRYELLETEQFSGIVELVDGDAVAAEEHLRAAHDGFRFVGVDVLAAQSAALLARAHLQLGEIEEAERFANDSERLGGQDLQASIAWRAVRAEILARRGEFEDARRLAESAVEIASRTDALIDHGHACQALAAVCAAAGDRDGARSGRERAFALYERKGATALLEEASSAEALPSSAAAVMAGPAPNAAFRKVRHIEELFGKRTWEAIESELAEDVVVLDRRRVVGMDVVDSRKAYMTQFKVIADIGTVRIVSTLVATRGERLALCRCMFTGEDFGSTAFGVELLQIFEFDQEGRQIAGIVFDIDNLDAAMAELDERFIAGEGAPYGDVVRAMSQLWRTATQKDWDGFREVVEDDVVFLDHRPASLGELPGREAWIESVMELNRLLPFRVDVLTYQGLAPNCAACQMRIDGVTAEGAAVEIAFQFVCGVRYGRITRVEAFPIDELDAALARFEELGREQPVGRGVLTNASARVNARFFEAYNRRDWAALTGHYADASLWEDRRSGLGAALLGPEAQLGQIKVMADLGVYASSPENVAVRGERLVLFRASWGSGDDANVFRAETLIIHEIDDDHRVTAVIVFDSQDLDAAFAELDERFIAGEGKAVEREVLLGLRLTAATNVRDWDAFRDLFMDDLVVVDHRSANLGELNGPSEYLDSTKTLVDLTSSYRADVIAYHAIDRTRAVAELFASGVSTDGVAVEIAWLAVAVSNASRDKIARLEFFPLEEREAALARFAELSRADTPRPALGNDASQVCDRVLAHFERRAWDRIEELYAEDFYVESRRAGLRHEASGREGSLEGWVAAADVGATRAKGRVLATRGQRLALTTVLFGDESPNGFSAEVLFLTELDGEGRIVSAALFDADDLDAAFAELDERFLAGEGRPYSGAVALFRAIARALSSREWAALRTCLTDDFVLTDHRPVSLGRMNADEWIQSWKTWAELAPDLRTRCTAYHALSDDRFVYTIVNTTGTGEWSGVETAVQGVSLVRGNRVAQMEFFPVEQLDAALARFEELGRPVAEGRTLENACSRMTLRTFSAFERRDWAALAAVYADDAVFEDRRQGLTNRWVGAASQVEQLKVSAALGGQRVAGTVLATRGERLALTKGVFQALDQTHGDFEVEFLVLEELENGRVKSGIVFDSSDLDAAMAELDERFVAGEGAPYADIWNSFARSFRDMNARDWRALRREFADDIEFVDHRPASLGTIRGGDATLQAGVTLVEVVPDVHWIAPAVHRIGDHHGLVEVLLSGTTGDGGGPIELTFLLLFEWKDRRRTRQEFFPIEQFDAALARFEELQEAEKDSLGPPENSAVRWHRLTDATWPVGDWAGYAALLSKDTIFEDRRHGLGTRLEGREAVVEHVKVAAPGAQMRWSVVATRGELLALFRNFVSIRGGYEVELLALHEFNEQGLVRTVLFDVDDVDAAFDELDARYVAGEGSRFEAVLGFGVLGTAAHRARDWATFREALAEDFVFVDHRPASLGRLGREELIDAAVGLLELIPDGQVRTFAILRVDVDRVLAQQAVVGSDAEGGDVQVPYLNLMLARGDRVTRIEFFPIEQLDAAVARFEELRPDAVRPALDNACLRAVRRLDELALNGDWDAVADQLADDVTLDDRRLGLTWHLEGRTAVLEQMRFLVRGSRIRHEPVATRGDRLALWRHFVLSGGFEIESLVLLELNEKGKHWRGISFDADDLDAAFAELDERYVQGEGAPFAEQVRLGATFMTALNARDWERVKTTASPDVVLIDHRPASAGEIRGRDELFAYTKQLSELAPDVRHRLVTYHAIDHHEGVAHWSVRGTNAEGGDVEITYLQVASFRRGVYDRAERFPVDQLDAALARFEELRHGTSRPELENAATRNWEGLTWSYNDRRWVDHAEAICENVVHEDRRKGLRDRFEGRRPFIDHIKLIAEMGAGLRNEVVATRGERLAMTLSEWYDPHGGAGSPTVRALHVNEVDADGRLASVTVFDPEEFDAALDGLNERYVQGEGRPYADLLRFGNRSVAALNARDWDTFASTLTSDVVHIDHRPASAGVVRGRENLVRLVRELTEVVPDVHHAIRAFHAIDPTVVLAEWLVRGTNSEGGAVEIDYLQISCLRDGLLARNERFAVDQLDAALARFDELTRGAHAAALENASSRSHRRRLEYLAAGDWEAAADLMVEDVTFEDRRSGVKWKFEGRDALMEHLRASATGALRIHGEPVAIRGERMALVHERWELPRDFVVESLLLIQADEHGRLLVAIAFDPDDLAAAFDELDERFLESEEATELSRLGNELLAAYNARDWVRFGKLFTEDFVVVDHRPVGRGVQGAEAHVGSSQELIALIPNLRMLILGVCRENADLVLARTRSLGTDHHGNPVEYESAVLMRAAGSQISSLELFSLDAIDEAMARVDELLESSNH